MQHSTWYTKWQICTCCVMPVGIIHVEKCGHERRDPLVRRSCTTALMAYRRVENRGAWRWPWPWPSAERIFALSFQWLDKSIHRTGGDRCALQAYPNVSVLQWPIWEFIPGEEGGGCDLKKNLPNHSHKLT